MRALHARDSTIMLFQNSKFADLACAALGAITVLSFAPYKLSPIIFLTTPALLLLWRNQTPTRMALRGFLFGAGLFGAGVSWVYTSMFTYGNMPMFLAVLATMIFVSILSVFPALAGWLTGLIARRWRLPWFLLVAVCVWTITEWLRSWIFTGFPWLSFGYSQLAWPLQEIAPWLGVYGVTFFVLLSTALLVLLFKTQRKLIVGLSLLAIWVGAATLQFKSWTESAGEPIDVAMVQGNIGLFDKWRAEQINKTITLLVNASDRQKDKDLIIWPESALPFYVDEVPEELWRFMREHPADFVTGLIERESKLPNAPYFNSVAAVAGHDASEPELYRKNHLVPFGEYFPLKPLLLWLLGSLEIPMADFSPWKPTQQPLHAAGQKLGISICYEDAFPEDIRQSLPDATLLINVSEDAWFGDSLAPHQRLQMGQMRALEFQRWMLRVSNSGGSAVIDARGRVVTTAPAFEQNTLTASAQPLKGATLFALTGSLPIVVLCLVLILIGFLLNKGNNAVS